MYFTLAKEFIYKGYNCFIVNSSGGWRNGYVEIPKDNMFFGKSFDSILPISREVLREESFGKRSPISLLCFSLDKDKNVPLDMLFNVHGGITYGNSKLSPAGKENSWFLGFDCNHCNDGKDYSIMDEISEKFEKEFGFLTDNPIRDEKYIESEIFSLVDQIIKFDNLYNNKK